MGISSSIVGNSLGATLSNITNIAQQYVVAPLAAFGMGGYVFSAQGEAIATLTADITDHYTESNQALQDHIAIRPKRITLKGYVGELVYDSGNSSPSTLNTLSQKLTVISAYLPALTNGVQQAQNTYTAAVNGTLTLQSAISSTSNIYGLVENILGATGNTKNQQNSYTYFKSLMESATLMGVQTPWEFMTNMAIESIIAFQDEKTQYISDFAITFKAIRIATTQTIAFSSGGTGGIVPAGGLTQQGDASIQAQNPVNLGTNPGASLPANLSGPQGALTSGQSFAPGSPIANIFDAGGS